MKKKHTGLKIGNGFKVLNTLAFMAAIVVVVFSGQHFGMGLILTCLFEGEYS